MDTAELLKKVRRIELKIKSLSKNIFSGEYHSAFKGRGMSFSEVRSYQYGDDVRNIDWNVTARANEPFVKIFEEEEEKGAGGGIRKVSRVQHSAAKAGGRARQPPRELGGRARQHRLIPQ